MSKNWKPDNPAWEVGCRDDVMAEAETTVTERLLAYLAPPPARPPLSVLDIGAGSGVVGKRLFSDPSKYHLMQTDVNPVPERGILGGDITSLWPLPPESFDIVHCRRVLTNVDLELRPTAVRELYRVLKRGGLLIIVDCFDVPYNNINEARAAASLPPLVPHMGKERLSADLFLNFTAEAQRTVAADYYVSTRLMWPIMLKDFALSPLRDITLTFRNVDHLCPHKVVFLRKDTV